MGGGSFKVVCPPPGSEEVNQFVYKHADCAGHNLTKKRLKWKFFEGECSKKERMHPPMRVRDYPECKKELLTAEDETDTGSTKFRKHEQDEADERQEGEEG